MCTLTFILRQNFSKRATLHLLQNPNCHVLLDRATPLATKIKVITRPFSFIEIAAESRTYHGEFP
jgi:hypothetical protein